MLSFSRLASRALRPSRNLSVFSLYRPAATQLSTSTARRFSLSVPAGVVLSTAISVFVNPSVPLATAADAQPESGFSTPSSGSDAGFEIVLPALPTQLVASLGFGGIAGFCSGYAVKKAVAVAAGLGFVAVQALSYCGVITVNWSKVEESIGPVTPERIQSLWQKGYNVLAYNAPFGAGFATGVLLGLKMG